MSTINREDAIDAVYERIRQIGYEHDASVRSIMQAIRDLPSVQSEQQWILCKEALPEVGTYVLVSKKSLGFRSNLPNVCTAHRSRDPRSGKEAWNDMLFGKLDDDDVLAWMPLPECYRGENDG